MSIREVKKLCCLVCAVKPQDYSKCNCEGVCSVTAREKCPHAYKDGCPLPKEPPVSATATGIA